MARNSTIKRLEVVPGGHGPRSVKMWDDPFFHRFGQVHPPAVILGVVNAWPAEGASRSAVTGHGVCDERGIVSVPRMVSRSG
jgi:hypothetical protein